MWDAVLGRIKGDGKGRGHESQNERHDDESAEEALIKDIGLETDIEHDEFNQPIRRPC
jgi:hypothetical protein